jgi:hypothetical protein
MSAKRTMAPKEAVALGHHKLTINGSGPAG